MRAEAISARQIPTNPQLSRKNGLNRSISTVWLKGGCGIWCESGNTEAPQVRQGWRICSPPKNSERPLSQIGGFNPHKTENPWQLRVKPTRPIPPEPAREKKDRAKRKRENTSDFAPTRSNVNLRYFCVVVVLLAPNAPPQDT